MEVGSGPSSLRCGRAGPCFGSGCGCGCGCGYGCGYGCGCGCGDPVTGSTATAWPGRGRRAEAALRSQPARGSRTPRRPGGRPGPRPRCPHTDAPEVETVL